jgi:hypothetical protein
MLNEQVLDALLAINVPADKARAAAISVTEYEPKLVVVEQRMTALELRMTVLEGKMTLLQWMAGLNTALVLAVLLKLFNP